MYVLSTDEKRSDILVRTKRVEKFRRSRRKKLRRIILYSFILPLSCILIGYLITSLIILPSMAK